MADIPEEHLTEELLDRLLASASIEQYLDEGLVSARTLTDYLFDRMEAHDLRRADVVRASGLNATVVYDIFSGKSRPGRDHAIMLAFGLKCTLRETQRLLRLAGVSELWCKQRRDAIIIWCIRMDSTALPRTTSCIVWERRRCCRPIDDIRPNNTHQ